MFEPPAVFAEWSWVLEGYEEVSTDRQIGGMGGQGAIPFSSIDRYAEREQFDQEEYRTFRRLVRDLDGTFFEHQAERSR